MCFFRTSSECDLAETTKVVKVKLQRSHLTLKPTAAFKLNFYRTQNCC